MKMNRRHMLAATGAATVSTGALRGWATTSMALGEHEILSISDGNLVLPGSMFFDGLPEDEVDEILRSAGLTSEQLTPACNLTLLRGAGRNVLFDAGSGPAFMPSAGMLHDSLDAIDMTPDDITHVVFTHAHPDHLWGVLDDFDDPVFPEATLMIARSEWAYWTDPDTVNTIGEARASFAVGAARRLEAVEDQLTFFNAGDEILPGVMAHGTPGHTPGHTSFEIRQAGDAVLVGGDAIGNHHVAFARPEWSSGADQDPDLGAATRTRLLDQIVADDIALLGFHLPHGGLGRVERSKGAYRFVAKDM